MPRDMVVLGLGSNCGNSLVILREAIFRLQEKIWRLREASFYVTDPMHVTGQPRFLNTAVCGYFEGKPLELLRVVNDIENSFGRDRSAEQRFGPRSLDIDILLFGDEIIDMPPGLIIPHPRLHERAFALVPLLELLPEALEPGTGKPYRDILAALPVQGVELLK